jgi:hypothetical protein
MEEFGMERQDTRRHEGLDGRLPLDSTPRRSEGAGPEEENAAGANLVRKIDRKSVG